MTLSHHAPQKATVTQKALASGINLLVVGILFLPFLLLELPRSIEKIIFLTLFFLYKMTFLLLNRNRTVGMIVAGTYWKTEYPFTRKTAHALLYTASVSTLLFWIVFPFDLFLANMLFLQLPFLLRKKMTFHEYLAGKMEAVY